MSHDCPRLPVSIMYFFRNLFAFDACSCVKPIAWLKLVNRPYTFTNMMYSALPSSSITSITFTFQFPWSFILKRAEHTSTTLVQQLAIAQKRTDEQLLHYILERDHMWDIWWVRCFRVLGRPFAFSKVRTKFLSPYPSYKLKSGEVSEGPQCLEIKDRKHTYDTAIDFRRYLILVNRVPVPSLQVLPPLIVIFSTSSIVTVESRGHDSH